MHTIPGRDTAAVYHLLTEALGIADELDLPIVAIHIDEARSFLPEFPGPSGPVDERR